MSQASLSRDVEAVRIPSGEKLVLPSGTEVVVTQALGGSFTILVPSQAGLYRVNGADADALGREAPAAAAGGDGPFHEDQLWARLRQCYDPEIPVNIVDLGLVYGLAVSGSDTARHVEVKMTLTAPGCGMGPSLAADAQQRLLSVPGVATANVELVWDPPWSPERISPEGRQTLGIG